MRVVYLAGREEEKPKKERKPTAKELRDQRADRWILKQRLKDYNKFRKDNAERIAEIQKHFPDWELPRPTLWD